MASRERLYELWMLYCSKVSERPGGVGVSFLFHLQVRYLKLFCNMS